MDMEKILQIKDPNEAMRQIIMRTLDMKEAVEAVETYAKHHGIEVDEMAWYPDGENVAATVTPGALLP